MTQSPTIKTYASISDAYDYFNKHLFNEKLPTCLITMQRHSNAYGFFAGGRFLSVDKDRHITDEIALNPHYFANRSAEHTLSTLVHEMVHLWQHHLDTPPKSSWHNQRWAEKMREVGLIPSSTGEPGGKEVGLRVSHYSEDNGRFARVCADFLSNRELSLYHDRTSDEDKEKRAKKKASKTKYNCPSCSMTAWAKPSASLMCGVHKVMLLSDSEPEN
jgi:predicted SprT family Zn-dependent metalloprotease